MARIYGVLLSLGLVLTQARADGTSDADIDALCRALGSDDFEERERAGRELERAGPAALEALRVVVAKGEDLDAKARAEGILFRIEAAEGGRTLGGFVEVLCRALEKGRAGEVAFLLDGIEVGPTVMKDLTSIHAKHDYRKLFKVQAEQQKEAIAKGELALGGHDFGHLTLLLKQGKDRSWKVFRLSRCY